MTDYENESRELIVDGQLIPVPSQREWKDILETGIYLGVSANWQSNKGYMGYVMDFIRKHPSEFCLGFIWFTAHKTSRIMLVLCWMDGGWHRVSIENVNCGNCDWRGKIANPLSPDIYYGAVDSRAAYKRGSDLSHIKCPKCGEESLPRRAIWTEKYPGEKDAA